jgi:hypothetical protein
MNIKIAPTLLVTSFIFMNSSIADGTASKTDDVSVQFGAFVDTYYTYDFDRPPGLNRDFTTTASRSNEFNINLAYLEAKLSGDRVRGRMALQAGTSVTANYTDLQSALGVGTGPGSSQDFRLLQNIQEAYLGYRVTDRLWVDAGIMFSYIGFENWISKNDWTYTRSLMADYSPYFMTGVRATYQWNDDFSTQLNVMNGWDNIYGTNQSKAVGVELAYTPNPDNSLTYNNFWGYQPGQLYRFFNDFIFTTAFSSQIKLAAVYDVGVQAKPGGQGNSIWQTWNAQLHYIASPTFSMTLRGEYYLDPDQVVVSTNTPNGFQVWGASINGDFVLAKHLLWRNEFRLLWSEDAVFPGQGGNQTEDPVVVTSLSLNL